MYFQKIANSNHISAWKSKGLSDESIKPLTVSNNSLAAAIYYINTKPRVKFDRSCLTKKK